MKAYDKPPITVYDIPAARITRVAARGHKTVFDHVALREVVVPDVAAHHRIGAALAIVVPIAVAAHFDRRHKSEATGTWRQQAAHGLPEYLGTLARAFGEADIDLIPTAVTRRTLTDHQELREIAALALNHEGVPLVYHDVGLGGTNGPGYPEGFGLLLAGNLKEYVGHETRLVHAGRLGIIPIMQQLG